MAGEINDHLAEIKTVKESNLRHAIEQALEDAWRSGLEDNDIAPIFDEILTKHYFRVSIRPPED